MKTIDNPAVCGFASKVVVRPKTSTSWGSKSPGIVALDGWATTVAPIHSTVMFIPVKMFIPLKNWWISKYQWFPHSKAQQA